MLAGLFFFRLALVWRSNSAHLYFYADSAPHVMLDWLQCHGAWGGIKLEPYWFSLVGPLRCAAWDVFPDIFYAPIALNALLGILILLFFYLGVRTTSGPGVGLLAGLLFVSVPSFCRLVLSGQPEVVYLLFISAAFYSICLSPEGGGSFIGLLAFWVSSYARTEGIGFFVIYSSFLCWLHRRQRLHFFGLIAVTTIALKVRFPALISHGYKAYSENSDANIFPFLQHVFYLPRSVFNEFDPSLALIALPLGLFWRLSGALKPPHPLQKSLRATCILAYGNLAMLLFSSWFFLMAWESERNLCAPLLLLSGCSAVALFDIYSFLPRRSLKITAIAALAATLLISWKSTLVPHHEYLSEPLLRARAIGRALRRNLPLAFSQDSGRGKVLLFENAEVGWADIAVFSGLGDSLRLINASSDPMFDPLRTRSGEEAWGMLVRTGMTKNRLDAIHGKSREICPVQDYTLYAFERR
ncbi:MAG: hypothetical protein AAB562_03470 [Patescibacteria group bacterium]